ncbi:MAG TPA: AsmA family protein [Gallionella sp.]|nr:AsmA family protein [Gallionella sp.]
MTRNQKWLAGIAVFLLLLVVTVNVFNWNLVRPYIERQVTASTGRSFEIKGDLEVHLSLWPRIIAGDIVLGNAAWSKDPVMAQIKRADFRISLPKLLVGRLSFPEISLSDIQLVLEVDKGGTPNWVFGKPDQQSRFPAIGALSVDHGTLKYRDPTTDTDLSLAINTLAAARGDPDTMVELTGKGRFKGMETTVEARGGALLALRSTVKPYPIKANMTLGTTRASIDGTLIDPLNFNNEEVNFRLEGSDLALLFPIAGIPLPPTPAYKLAGYLSHSGDIWTFKRFKGTVGKSDLTGNFSVDNGKTPQLITADVESLVLDMSDLAGIIGADSAVMPSDKVLPTDPFNLDKLRAADADVRFKGGKIITKKLPIEKMEAHLTVKDGALRLDPLNFGIAGGELVTVITMDGRKSHLLTHADITAKGLYLQQLFPESKLNASSEGTLGGRATLDAGGDSISQMMGSANGDAALIMDGGTISELLLRMSSLDIANSFLVLLGGDKQVPVRCMVANFKAVGGDFRVQDLVLDTAKVNITGEGNVNFADESLHLKLVSQSKGFSLASLRGPILVTGAFKDPKAKPDMGKVVTRGGLAAGLGAVTAGIGALLPLLEFGKKKDSNCAALMSQAKSDAGIKQSDIAPH